MSAPLRTEKIAAELVTVLVGLDQFPLDLGDDDFAGELAALREQEPAACAQRVTAIEFAHPEQYNTTVTAAADARLGVVMDPELSLDFATLADVPLNLLNRIDAVLVPVFE